MIKKGVIRDLFGTLVIVIVNMINHVTDVGEYLDYKNCKCRRKIVGEVVEECSENIDENKMIYNETLNVSLSDYKCNFCTPCMALFVVF